VKRHNVVKTRRVAIDTCSWLTHQVVLSKSIRNLFLTTFICENNCSQELSTANHIKEI